MAVPPGGATYAGWREWSLPLLLALLLHAALLWLLPELCRQPTLAIATRVMEVSLTRVSPPAPKPSMPEQVRRVEPISGTLPEPEQKAEPRPRQEPLPVRQSVQELVKPEHASRPEPAPVSHPVAMEHSLPPLPEALTADAARAGVAEVPATGDSEPVFAADDLDNPPPVYPRIARRRGLEGRVLLNVEVLASGRCGRIAIENSSGHEVLDKAALNAVKQWHFRPASRAGMAVDCWCHIPVRFRLGDSAARR
ncbi:energy transducer TonB [Mariprofundus erugo]|uniref:Protein TonB n=1 Tax=Mariprofundus erugo TaxID=2528639 RepID=A0A5R9GTH3_9PROT|nr:energy transducer TonB [Mariprofundus erugo]TLS66554.1 energy transducer TonB [Mariprofundus erugo]